MERVGVIFLFLFLSLCEFANAQVKTGTTIKGSLKDTLNAKLLDYASISLLNQKDSVLYKGLRADEQGSFLLNNVSKGEFILQVSFPGYQDVSIPFSINSNSPSLIDFKVIHLSQKQFLVDEVTISARRQRAISVNGDTIEFMADSFKVVPNARVEDLLKRLPNFKIDDRGKVIYGAENISKILVDGEEFFTSDPTLVTRNVRADMVQTVQVFDHTDPDNPLSKKLGDDKQKIVNLKLKENKKNGNFGKVEGGAGIEKLYQGQLMLNSFKNNRKLAVYSIFSNTGLAGLNWQDEENFSDGERWNGSFDGKGLPVIQTGGVHYSNKWNEGKHRINANAKIANLDVSGINNTLVQIGLPQTTNYSAYNQEFHNKSLRNKADFRYEHQPSANTSFIAVFAGALDRIRTAQRIDQQLRSESFRSLNQSNRYMSTDGQLKHLNMKLNWNHTLSQTGRNISLEIIQTFNEGDDNNNLQSENTYYSPQSTGTDSVRTINQHRDTKTNSFSLQSKLIYAEPLSKTSSLLLDLSTALTQNSSDVRTFNQNANNQAANQLARLSNNYDLRENASSAGLTHRYQKAKLSFSTTAEINFIRRSQTDRMVDQFLKRNYIIFTPQFRAKYAFNSQRSFTLQYAMNSILPEISQLQPLAINDDPFNIISGNPVLNPSPRNSIKILAKDYIPEKEESFLLNGSILFIQDPIVTSFNTSQSGINIYSFQNAKGRTVASTNLSFLYGRRLKLWALRLTSNTVVSLAKQINYTNGLMNEASNNFYSSSLGLHKSKSKHYDFSIHGSVKYTAFKNSIDAQFNQAFFTYSFITEANYYIDKSLQAHSDVSFKFQQKTSVLYNSFNQVLWNVSMTKTFESSQFSLKISANDILNQNRGFIRTAADNRFTQNSFSTITRNFMITLIYDINKLGT